MTTETQRPEFDLTYSIDDFTPGTHRDSTYIFKAIEDAMVDAATEVRGGRVLDVACGTGKQALRIAERGCYAVGAEASMEMIGVGRWLQPESGAVMLRSLAESLPFADGTFDRVICQGSLDHFADPHAFMREAARVTKPDGRVVIALANFESVSCKLGRGIGYLGRRMGRARPPWRRYWEIPEDHTVKGDLPYVRGLGGDNLVIERLWGISLFCLSKGYGKGLDLLPGRAASAIWRGFDAIARRRPQDSDMIICVWRKRDARSWKSGG